MIDFFTTNYWQIGYFFVFYFALVNIIYGILLIIGLVKGYRRVNERNKDDIYHVLKSNSLPEFTFLVPCFNEEENIIRTVENLLNLTYSKKQIIIINDGSTDKTLDLLKIHLNLHQIEQFFTHPLPSKPILGVYKSPLHDNVLVIDKENGGRQDAFNAALGACTSSFFVTIDGDTIVDDQEFDYAIRPILFHPETVAVGAGVRILNDCDLKYHGISTEQFPKNFLTSVQSLEYLRTFIMREGLDAVGGNFCISGAFSVLSTKSVIECGGFGHTFANDLEIVTKLHRYYKATGIPYRIFYLGDPVAWTEAPSTLKTLGYQRKVWHRGLLESLWFHKRMFLNPYYGSFGLFVLPFAFIGEALEPIVEILGYLFIILGLYFGVIGWEFAALILLISWGITMVYSIFSLTAEEYTFKKYPSKRSLFILFLHSIFENIGYRQLTLLWRANGFLSFFGRFNEIHEDSKKLNEFLNKKIKEYNN